MASQHEVENRVNEAEDLLCAGLSGGLIERKLSERYKVTTRQARSYVARVYERWKEQRALDQPHRREKVLRMIERFYAKAMLDKQYSAAATALGLLTKMVGVSDVQEGGDTTTFIVKIPEALRRDGDD